MLQRVFGDSATPQILTGIFTLAGVALAQGFSYLSDRRKTRHDDSVRWHQEINAASLELLHAIDSVMATVRVKSQPDPTTIRTIYESAVRLELVAPAKLAAAALEVHDYVEMPRTDHGQDLTTNRLESLRDRVVERLRAAIGTDDIISYDIDELRRRAKAARRNTKWADK